MPQDYERHFADRDARERPTGPNGPAMRPVKISGPSRAEKVEIAIWDHQHDVIKTRFGEQAADLANYGWGTTNLPGGASVATKVYGHGVLTTTSEELGVFQDEWEDR